jgi:DNA-binding transcriptional ArsR family regulator
MTSEERQFGARLFSALAHPSRLVILDLLAAGPASVTAIMAATGQKQATTSQHLAALLSVGAVLCTPDGKRRIYRLRGPRLARVLELVEEMYDAHLESLRQALRHREARGAMAPHAGRAATQV